MKYTRPVNETDYAKYETSPNQKADTSSISSRAIEKRLKMFRSDSNRREPLKPSYPASRRAYPWHNLSLSTKYRKPHQGNKECARRAGI